MTDSVWLDEKFCGPGSVPDRYWVFRASGKGGWELTVTGQLSAGDFVLVVFRDRPGNAVLKGRVVDVDGKYRAVRVRFSGESMGAQT